MASCKSDAFVFVDRWKESFLWDLWSLRKLRIKKKDGSSSIVQSAAIKFFSQSCVCVHTHTHTHKQTLRLARQAADIAANGKTALISFRLDRKRRSFFLGGGGVYWVLPS